MIVGVALFVSSFNVIVTSDIFVNDFSRYRMSELLIYNVAIIFYPLAGFPGIAPYPGNVVYFVEGNTIRLIQYKNKAVFIVGVNTIPDVGFFAEVGVFVAIISIG